MADKQTTIKDQDAAPPARPAPSEKRKWQAVARHTPLPVKRIEYDERPSMERARADLLAACEAAHRKLMDSGHGDEMQRKKVRADHEATVKAFPTFPVVIEMVPEKPKVIPVTMVPTISA